MSDQTPLTAESEALLAMAEHWRDDCKTQCAVTARVRDAVHLIETAAARRAIEGSGMVEALVEATSLLPEDAPEPGPYPDMSAVWYERGWDDRGDAILAALPRPEEPRVERCAVCGVGRWVIAHDPEAGPSHHPFTPEAR